MTIRIPNILRFFRWLRDLHWRAKRDHVSDDWLKAARRHSDD